MERIHSIFGTLGAVWGLAGVLALLLSAVFRLWPKALDAFSYSFDWYHWTTLILVVLGMAYTEGYKGFQKAFSPRTVARARHLRLNPRLEYVIFAPFFCMGYFHATKRRMITSISLTLGIIVLIVLVSFTPQPWRGIIDAGVIVGLVWGIASLFVFAMQALTLEEFPYSPEIPEKER